MMNADALVAPRATFEGRWSGSLPYLKLSGLNRF